MKDKIHGAGEGYGGEGSAVGQQGENGIIEGEEQHRCIILIILIDLIILENAKDSRGNR
jgi:hypothetical protein